MFRFLTLPLLLAVNLINKPDCTLELHAPDVISPSQDYYAELICHTPTNTKITIPDLSNRLQGFSSFELIPSNSKLDGGSQIKTFRCRLTPSYTEPYRLAPFPVVITSHTNSIEYITTPVRFNALELPQLQTKEWEGSQILYSISMSLKEYLQYILILLLLPCLILLAYCSVKHIKRRIVEAHYTPAQRALADIDILLKKQLPQHGKIKDFYVSITRIVRVYIQRTTPIRATNQTTEEFLSSAQKHAISAKTTQTLGDFLRAADYVKFARAHVTQNDIDVAINTARTYILSDEHERQAKSTK